LVRAFISTAGNLGFGWPLLAVILAVRFDVAAFSRR
jgi:hypothetical protein